MGKKVRVTIEVDEQFVRLLKANVQLSGLGNLRELAKQHQPMAVLGVVVLLEAMGQTPENIHAETPIEWRNNIEAISSERRVYMDGVLISNETKVDDNKTSITKKSKE